MDFLERGWGKSSLRIHLKKQKPTRRFFHMSSRHPSDRGYARTYGGFTVCWECGEQVLRRRIVDHLKTFHPRYPRHRVVGTDTTGTTSRPPVFRRDEEERPQQQRLRRRSRRRSRSGSPAGVDTPRSRSVSSTETISSDKSRSRTPSPAPVLHTTSPRSRTSSPPGLFSRHKTPPPRSRTPSPPAHGTSPPARSRTPSPPAHAPSRHDTSPSPRSRTPSPPGPEKGKQDPAGEQGVQTVQQQQADAVLYMQKNSRVLMEHALKTTTGIAFDDLAYEDLLSRYLGFAVLKGGPRLSI